MKINLFLDNKLLSYCLQSYCCDSYCLQKFTVLTTLSRQYHVYPQINKEEITGSSGSGPDWSRWMWVVFFVKWNIEKNDRIKLFVSSKS